jgi:1,4-dihydroxy-2-naphthoyl-CoA hydrolase
VKHDGFDRAYGLELSDATHGSLTVAPDLLGPDGTVLSGVYAAVAESIASTGTAYEVFPKGMTAAGLSNSTYVVGELSEGELTAVATCRARGELEWLWDVAMGPPGGPPTALATVAIAVRPPRS